MHYLQCTTLKIRETRTVGQALLRIECGGDLAVRHLALSLASIYLLALW